MDTVTHVEPDEYDEMVRLIDETQKSEAAMKNDSPEWKAVREYMARVKKVS